MLNGIFTLIYHNHVRDFLICSGREEFLRFNLENFWNTERDRIESQEWMNLSWYHPLRLFTKFICKLFSHESDSTFSNAQWESALGVGGPTLHKYFFLCGKKMEMKIVKLGSCSNYICSLSNSQFKNKRSRAK